VPKTLSELEKIVKEIEKEVTSRNKNIRDDYDTSIIRLIGEEEQFKGNVISTGFPSLDYLFGVGGLPCGRIIEIFGRESTGKSTLALQLIKKVQDEDKVVALVDVENSFVFDYAESLGLKKDNFILSEPQYGEQAIDVVLNLIRDVDNLGMIVIDSVAALVPKSEHENTMNDSVQPGTQARLMSQACRKLVSFMKFNKDAIVLFINQTRMKIGTYGNPETTSGGESLKFYAHVRLRMSYAPKASFPKIGNDVIGTRIKIKSEKNKISKPFKEIELDLIHGYGFDRTRDIFEFCLKEGVIEKNGHTYKYIDSASEEHRGVGREKFLDIIKNNEILRDELFEKCEQKLNENKEEN
jgi:recombination protein RecA